PADSRAPATAGAVGMECATESGTWRRMTMTGQRTLSGSPRVPKYYQVKKQLLELIDAMPAGNPVPPERTLATQFATSRTTVRQALTELVVEGRLLRIQ